jgi:hypothetical protein
METIKKIVEGGLNINEVKDEYGLLYQSFTNKNGLHQCYVYKKLEKNVNINI